MEARDIMTVNIITVGPDTPVKEIARTLLENGVSAVPVVDANQRVLGIVSEGDLMRRADIGTDRQRSWWLKTFAAPPDLAREFVKSRGTKASEVMTGKVLTITESTPVSKIAEILEKNRIKRVPVTRRGKIVGIVSRANLLHGLTTQLERAVKPPRKSDREIRERIMQLLAREAWAEPGTLNVTVQKGHVEVWGFVDSREQEKALRVALENVRGVKSFEIHAGLKRYAYL
jgi:CBS domain-containing protein